MNNLNDMDYEDISPNFSIENLTDIVLNTSLDNLFSSFKIVPNPSCLNSHFHFEVFQPEQVSILVYNLDGRKVDEIPKHLYSPNVYNISWTNKGLKPGIYFCLVYAGNRSKTFKIQIIK